MPAPRAAALNRSLAEANTRLAQAHSTLQAEKTRELEQLNATLREANRHKDEFLAMLAHELRNPLAPIHNAVQLMRNTAAAGRRSCRGRARSSSAKSDI